MLPFLSGELPEYRVFGQEKHGEQCLWSTRHTRVPVEHVEFSGEALLLTVVVVGLVKG